MGILDIIGPVMVGPSSSHTAGAARIGRFARGLLGRAPEEADIGLHGSFAATGQGHGTRLALLGGLLGFLPDDERIPGSEAWAGRQGLAYRFREEDLGNVHPNSARLRVSAGDAALEVRASSVGGGRIQVWSIDGFEVDISGDYPTLLLAYPDQPGAVAVASAVLAGAGLNLAAIKAHRRHRGGQALTEIQLDAAPPPAILEDLRNRPPFESVRFIPALDGGLP